MEEQSRVAKHVLQWQHAMNHRRRNCTTLVSDSLNHNTLRLFSPTHLISKYKLLDFPRYTL